jgi:hypothetical protein
LSSSTGFTTLQTELSGPFLVDGSYYVNRLLLSFMGVLPASMIVATIAAAITAAAYQELLTRAAIASRWYLQILQVLSLKAESLGKAN